MYHLGTGICPSACYDMGMSDERLQRYATAIELASGIAAERPQIQKEARAVMAVADAEQAELRAEIENLRTTVRMDLVYMRMLEAKVARVEAVVNDEFGFTYDAIRAALAGDPSDIQPDEADIAHRAAMHD
ncbi:hypothetical protein UB45_07560 [Terrabacter sp. 28]|nr:hypothetical protein UB45_07560 [Terrabacter sp. 28]